MIQSMTGFAAASAETPRGRLSVELRSVNARFLDLQFRIADDLRALEPALRELVTARVSRGKLDCRVYLNDAAAPAANELNPQALAQLRELAARVQKEMPQATPLRAAAVAERVAAMRARLDDIAPLVPQSLAAYQAKLAERLREALGSADDDRVRAELAVFASKADVDEEMTRLKAHLSEVDRTLAHTGGRDRAIGKRLDFIAQELNREANTLASKAASQEISDCALELKLLIEQMREQVQNIE